MAGTEGGVRGETVARVDVVPPDRDPRETGPLRVGFGPQIRGRRDLPSLSVKSVSEGSVTQSASHWGQTPPYPAGTL
jgi:hypothetical protein